MPNFIKRSAIMIGKLIAGFVGFFVVFMLLYLGYALYAEPVAEKRATAICNSIKPGDDAAVLLQRALSDGADKTFSRIFKGAEQEELVLTYIGTPPFSRYLCRVRLQDGKAVSAELSHLD